MARSGRKRHWGRFATLETAVVANGVTLIDLSSLMAAELSRTLVDLTVVRVIGVVDIRRETVGVTSSRWSFGIRIGTIDETAATAPDPELDDADWMYHQQRVTHGARTANEFNRDRLEFDNRSARKMGGSRGAVIAMLTNSDDSLAIRFSLTGRILVLD